MFKIKLSIIVASLFISSFVANGQTQVRSNKQVLQSFAAQRTSQYEQRRQVAMEYAKKNNIPVFIKTDKLFMELQYIDENGAPVYYQTQNVNAAKTISTNKVLPGGSLGLNLTGAGLTAHEWDGGSVGTSHQEFGGRAVQGDSPSATHYHSAHVAGTIIASGVQANAKGMAPGANLRAFDWNNDVSEMATEASNGAIVSNHSYGYTCGWAWNGSSWQWYGTTSISTQEDYRFGFYNSNARDYDIVAHNAPHYLIVKAAGNDRGDGPTSGSYPQDGPYDCISPLGVAKNVLTVGAVEDIINGYSTPSDVVMSSFSSWGPCDDGRIKPDLVANGVSLYSCSDASTSGYNTLSGTSMATPSVTGSLILLQQHYQNLNGTGNLMTAASLKAVAINTCDEAGPNIGPDYMFGWGLMNTAKAAALISKDKISKVIFEESLSNGGTYQKTIQSNGTEPIRVTIVWTDVAGTPTANMLDPTDAMLVNDLDIKITKDSYTYYPWKLNRNSPSAAATNNSKNSVDNVEVIDIPSPSAGTYTIVVNHAGTLSGGSQDFSIVISGTQSAPVQEKPVANFSVSTNSVSVGESITFTDNSTNVPTSWSWTINGGTPSASTLQNPTVIFNTPGTYSVTLSATNQYGTGTITKANLITVADKSYCESNGKDYSYEWISSVKVGTFTNASTATGYSDFTSKVITLTKGVAANIELTPAFKSTTYNEYWKIWVDLNNDKDFDDAGELVFDAGTLSKTTVTGTITIPVNTATTTTRMRISMKYDGAPSPCESFGYGEVEDYTVVINDPTVDTQAPSIPTGLTASNITETSATISWSASTDNVAVTGYDIFQNGVLKGSTATTSFNVTGLIKATTYSFTVKAKDAAANISANSAALNVTTLSSQLTYCSSNGKNSSYEWIDLVKVAEINNITGNDGGYKDYTSNVAILGIGTTERLTVSCGFNNSSYTEFWNAWIDYNQDGVFSDTENIMNGSSSSAAEIYADFNVPSDAVLGNTRMRVSMKYDSNGTACESFAYGEVEDYTINIVASKTSSQENNSTNNGAVALGFEKPSPKASIFPNPTSGLITIILNNEINSDIRIYSEVGKLIKTIMPTDKKLTIDLTNYPNGIYTIIVATQRGSEAYKIVKL